MGDPTNKFVIPKEGLIVRTPRFPYTPLAKEGGWVPWIGPDGRYWRKRLRTGDVTTVKYFTTEEKQPKKPAPEVAEKESEKTVRRRKS